MNKQRERARSARNNDGSDGWKEDVFASLDKDIKSTFVGYTTLKEASLVKAIVKGDEIVSVIEEGDEAVIILDKTPFYAESGGQAGDKGILCTDMFECKVVDTKKGINERIHHEVKVVKGSIKVGDTVNATVDCATRKSTGRNHSATHILHKSLKEVLGDHVQQAGSLVNSERLRFDFTHFEGISKDELLKIEKLVNEQILNSLEIEAKEMSIDEAKAKGATALFGEKYGNVVRVVTMGDFSMELCGGTHLNNTSEIGLFKIISESGVAAGVRRIEAMTGIHVYNYINEKEEMISKTCEALKTREDNLVHKAKAIVEEVKELHKEISSLKSKLSMGSVDEMLNKKEEIKGVNLVVGKFEGMDMDSLRNMADTLKDKLSSGVVVLGNVVEDKINFVVNASDDVIKKGAHAGNIIKEVAKIAGGSGGGRPNMAQAGGKDISKVDEALNHAKVVLENQIKG